MVNLGAITLSASINSEPISDAQLLNYYSVKRSGDGSNFITLTLNSLPDFSDNIIYTINVISTIPDTYINNNNYGPIAGYCVIGAGKVQDGGGYGGAVKYTMLTSNFDPYLPMDMSIGTIHSMSMRNNFASSLGVAISLSGGGGLNTPGVKYPLQRAYGFNNGNKENFYFGTGITYGKSISASTTYGSVGGFGVPIGGAIIIQYYWPPPITSDICFPAGTPVKTDQGLLPIEKLKQGINTINRNRIEHITRTITNDNYLVCFEKDSLDINLPIRRTLISKNHKILYKNKMIEAYKFIHSFHGVHKVEYKGETLYNVLMDDYYTMDVNNLICETLHPSNVIAQIHNSSYSAEDKNKIICMLSETLKNKDSTTYKKMAMTLTSKK
jgi:hypothetical protein